MQYDEFLSLLGNAIDKHQNMTENGACNEIDLTPVNEANISGDITRDITFDGNGNWCFNYSQYCPINIDASAYINDEKNDVFYDVSIDTNYPEHHRFNGIRSGQQISVKIKTNTFSKTSLQINVHSNKPNSKGTFHLHYSL